MKRTLPESTESSSPVLKKMATRYCNNSIALLILVALSFCHL